jgi:hypothetical protein
MSEHDPQPPATQHLRDRYHQLILVALETAVELAASSHDTAETDELERGLAELHPKLRALAHRLAAIIEDPHAGDDGLGELREFRAAIAAIVPRPR